MNVILNTIYKDGFAATFIDEIADYTKQGWLPHFVYDGVPVLYGEYCLEINLMVGVGHKVRYEPV